MPGIARKILICAAVDGLIIQPLSAKGQRPFSPVQLRYGDAHISSLARDAIPDVSKPGSSFEAFGIVGLITVSKLSYLISITRRQQVATVFGFPVYVITEVAVTPISSKPAAEDSIQRTGQALRVKGPHNLSDDSDSSSDEGTQNIGAALEDVEDAVVEDDDASPESGKSSVAEDVMRRRGSYGRFAQSWFSRSGWTLEQKKQMGLSVSPTVSPKPEKQAIAPAPPKAPQEEGEAPPGSPSTLLPKLLRTVQILFGSSRSFFFSYDVDVTRSLTKSSAFPGTDTPLYERVDPVFFWNKKVMEPFMSAGQDAIALPLMQGFVGQRSFTVDSNPPQKDDAGKTSVEMQDLVASRPSSPPPPESVKEEQPPNRASERSYLITLISRRSTKRAGLRYLRRGINEEGYVANMVETEQVLAPSVWEADSKIYSFLQVRGSIPLFFTQSAYSLKPVPVLQHTNDVNYEACRQHLDKLTKSYGKVQIVNLVEKHGVEEALGTRFQRTVERYNDDVAETAKASFEWFDFHRACRGMKFENVSLLLSSLGDVLETMGSTERNGDQVAQKQNGILRTNCMDCLDRTNVCQSSFGKYMLEAQLRADGIDLSAQQDQETSWFNTLWADNGDAVSKQYASTAAMKGDYTRTRKRDYRGALNDLGLSLARFYSGMVNDYFSQTAIDLLLGNVTEKVLDEFEADMMIKDPAVSVAKMREQAIDLCHRRVVADEKEEYHGGWVLTSPGTSDTIKAWPMEEVVLLLTDSALYLCRFDWDMDKVSSFERISLTKVQHIKFGTYITSTRSPSQTDELRNVGFIVTYQPGKSDIKRTNTRTTSTNPHLSPEPQQDASGSSAKAVESGSQKQSGSSRPTSWASFLGGGKPKSPATKSIAFKALYKDSSVSRGSSKPEQTEAQQVNTICAEIERLALDAQPWKAGEEKDRKGMIEKGDIISLETAKKNTGLLEQLGHSLKRLVWA